MQIESAYDMLLMQNMRARMSGQMNVKNSVRFADVPSKKSAQQVPSPVRLLSTVLFARATLHMLCHSAERHRLVPNFGPEAHACGAYGPACARGPLHAYAILARA